ncbi:MAG TPA: hypothetical protein VF519_17080 [Mycobacteriales bacterium]|jgi:hypothetical protein
MTRTLLAAAVLAATVAVPAGAAAPVVTMAGTTTFRAARAAWVDVRVPRDATVATPFGDSPDLRVRGSGRVTAFVLAGRGDRSNDSLYGGASWLDGATFLVPAHVEPGVDGGYFEQVKTHGDVTTVRAGTYRLHLVPDGGAAEVTLTLHGLAGRATYDVTGRGNAAVDGGQVVGANPFHATVTRELPSAGYVIQLARAEVAVTPSWQLAMCYGPVPDGPSAQAPPCANGRKQSLDERRFPYVPRRALLFAEAYPLVRAGTSSVTTTLAVESVVTRRQYVSVWVVR